MISQLVKEKQNEIDALILSTFDRIPKVECNMEFSAEFYGFSWIYQFRKDGSDIYSTLRVGELHSGNVLVIEFDQDDHPVALQWRRLNPSFTILNGKSTLKIKSLAWWYIQKFMHIFGPTVSIITVLSNIIVASYYPKATSYIILLSYILEKIDMEQYLIPYSILNDVADRIYQQLPPFIAKFLRIRVLVFGIKAEDGIMYFLGSCRNGKFEIRPIDKCPNGTHLCILLQVDLGNLAISSIEIDVIEFKRQLLEN